MNQLIDNSKCFQSNKLDYLYRFIIYLNFKLKIRVFFLKFKEFSNNQSPLLTYMLWRITITQITNKLFQKSIDLVSIIYLIIRNIRIEIWKIPEFMPLCNYYFIHIYYKIII